MITKTISGNYIHFRFQGAPADVERDVNRYYNFGVLVAIPDTFKPGEHGDVTAHSYKKNAQAGFESMAHFALSQDKTRTRGMKGRPNLFLLAVQADAWAMFNAIPRVSVALETERETEHMPEVPEGELSAYSRRVGKKILAEFRKKD